MQIGLTGGVFTGADGTQISDAEYLNAGGQVAGTSHRVVGPGTDSGTSTWVYDSARLSTLQTGLTDAAHSGSGGYQYSNNTFQDDNGVVMGYSRRYTGVNTQCGEDAWYYDPTTGMTTQATGGVPDTVYVATNYAYSKAVAQTDSGFMLGYYRRYPGGVGGAEQRAFIYRPDLGFSDLGDLVDGGLAQAGWDQLLSADFGPSADWVGGAGLVAGQNPAGGSQSAFIMRRLIALCPADFNADGAVDFFDYDAFVVAFETGDPKADFDRDGTLDVFDYDAFVVAFEIGC